MIQTYSLSFAWFTRGGRSHLTYQIQSLDCTWENNGEQLESDWSLLQPSALHGATPNSVLWKQRNKTNKNRKIQPLDPDQTLVPQKHVENAETLLQTAFNSELWFSFSKHPLSKTFSSAPKFFLISCKKFLLQMSSGAQQHYPEDAKPNCLSVIIAVVCSECSFRESMCFKLIKLEMKATVQE